MAKGKVTFDQEYCKGCALCVSVCPKDVLALKTDELNPKGYRPAYAKIRMIVSHAHPVRSSAPTLSSASTASKSERSLTCLKKF